MLMPPRKKKKESPAAQAPAELRRPATRPRWKWIRTADGGLAAVRLGGDSFRTQATADFYGDVPMLSTGANMRPVSSIITEVMSTLNLKEAEVAPELLEQAWRVAVGDFLASQATLSSLGDARATIRTSHPAVRFELQRRKADIIHALNATLGEGCVRTVRIVHGD